MKPIQWAINEMPKTEDSQLKVMALDEIKKARIFHESFPQYSTTPLAKLDNMASYLGVKELFVKDESYRFGLNAFKVLGGSFAMAKYIAQQTNKDVSELPYNVLTSDKLREEFGQATFFTATDGNHGRGVAWAANKLKQKAVVYMPKGSTKTRFDNIAKENATVTIEEVNYDECVRMAAAAAAETPHGVVVQDTAWDGYEEIPAWIMQGYGTMAMEATEQLNENGCDRPTHVFVQAGVGSLAGAVTGYFVNRYPENPPKIVVAEAEAAACLYKGAAAKDGKIRIVEGDLETIQAGLACGEPNTISWDILKNHVTAFVSCPDWVATKGMRLLAAPFKGDPQVISGESGAVPTGLLAAIMQMDEYKDLRDYLQLDENSKVLAFSTEGDTDPDRFKEIVWDGKEY
ncbi:diaminopropionate ammonia-lyase [Anaerocolumna aminovalerica]|jgi:diaminopropionate ammonia-lyase|uniref:Diaminopropionate ammonia-lyase n=1 Tax=Anaerocolumna aminovalerica TaxID=1527 RepID=A0A1I5E5U6_9FIRM|nr:diaminopropionate ammonia-lyase [Anaerocolumna aminovalerica]MBU5330807.1 diaminopropionate ammonia-lyase [Anaerocolumna aminovalerica]MDU6263378.1 diaminopropionate ammonia-lyase [Anaerocolumna aminovalerica]SFO06918.1 diaminopropionate ammonia-lyase [Anaerocolumna aminovalerica]